MPRLIWSPSALQDIARLHGFLKSKNPDAAQRAVKAIRQGVRLFATHPEAGRPADDMPPEFREWVIDFGSGGYVSLYRYDGTDVVILAVRHTREAGY
jgi:plasmid stabilization system protein ParE